MSEPTKMDTAADSSHPARPPPGVSSEVSGCQAAAPTEPAAARQDRVVTGIAAYDQFVFVVHDYGDKLCVYTQSGLLKPLKTFLVRGMQEPVGIVLTNSDNLTLCISDFDSKKLLWVTLSASSDQCEMLKQDHQELSYQPGGICADVQRQTVVVTDPYGHRLHLYGPQRSIINTINLPDHVTPWQVAADRDGGYIICDIINKQMVWATRDVKEIKIIKSDDDNCKFKDPNHVIIDKKGRLILADYGGDNVLEMSEKGEYIRDLLNQGNIVSPTRLALNQGKLWISHDTKAARQLSCVNLANN